MTPPPPRSAIIVAGGSSSRMGFDKLSAPLLDRPVLWHSLHAFSRCPHLHQIVLVCLENNLSPFASIAADFPLCSAIVPGGPSRSHSVLNGLLAASEKNGFVAVHDAARPLISPTDIENCFLCAEENGSAVCAEPLADSLHKADENGFLQSSVDRTNLWRMQTPQIFPLQDLLSLYKKMLSEDATTTDEAGAFLLAGKKVKLFPNSSPNFKITYPGDIALAEAALQSLLSCAQKSPD